MSATASRRTVPAEVRKLPLGQRMRWARRTAKLSHDGLVASMGRSNRGHLIKVEHGTHTPRPDLRDAWADATNVPRDLFADDDEEDHSQMIAVLMPRAALSQIVREELARATA